MERNKADAVLKGPANSRKRAILLRVGQAVHAWRVRHHYSQERLASLLGVSLRTIVRLEDGEHDPRYSMLVAMEKLGANLFSLLALTRRGLKPATRKRRMPVASASRRR